MINRDELETIYMAILAAARRKGLTRYSELIALQNQTRGQNVRVKLKTRLNELLKICKRRNWPAMPVIVVGQHDDLLSDNSLSKFTEGAVNAGYSVQNKRKFEATQRQNLYDWAPTAPDTLDLSDQEIQDLFNGTRDWHVDDDSLIDDSDQEDSGGETTARPDINPPRASGGGPKDSTPQQDIGTSSDENNEKTISQLREEVETLKKEQKKTDKTIKELQQEVKKNHKESLERTDSKFDKLSKRLVYFILGIVAIVISAVGVSFAI